MKNYIMKHRSTDEEIGIIKNGCLRITYAAFKGTYPLITATDIYDKNVTGYLFGTDECYERFINGKEYFYQYLFDADNGKYYKCLYGIPEGEIENIDWEHPAFINNDFPWYYMEETK